MFPEDTLNWFLARGITEETLRHFGIWWNGERIVIPIKDVDGKTLFNKYRRNPAIEDGPKYIYDKGSKISLYNFDPKKKEIVLCEGELDAVRLHEEGIYATTSTSGAGSFQEEWLLLLKEKQLIVCFDNDEAGMRGALKIALLRPETRFVSFPEYWKGKDVTDFLTNHTKEEFESLLQSSYALPINNPKISTSLNLCAEMRRTLKYKHLSTALIDKCVNYLNEEKLRIKNKETKAEFTTKIDNIKQVPITQFIDFNIAGFARCIFGHTDKTPSMKYYPETNSVYCFSCTKYADVISVIREQQKISFVEAVKFLQERYGK